MTNPPAQDAIDSSNASLFSRIFFPTDAYCELRFPDGNLRNHWQSLAEFLDSRGMEHLLTQRKRISRMRHEDGATYNPFESEGEDVTSWALDIVPMPIPEEEWKLLENAVIQRAHVLENFLADVYGPQNILKKKVVPPELLFANQNYLRTSHDIIPVDNRYLSFLAVDLYKDINGSYRVYRDHGACPSGLGYALENRILLSRIFSTFYQNSQVCRLAPFFQEMHETVMDRAERRQVDPGTVILSPGPQSPLYFEHALLSRYLGYPLVESQDLTVRNGNVYLKKLVGLEPVEIIHRYLDDLSSDPFTVRKGTNLGVAGLLQASREQNVDIINPIGSGIVETPVLSVFLNDICRYFMGSDLMLPNHSSWWCGHDIGRNHVYSNINNLVVKQSMESADKIPANLLQAIEQFPYRYMAEEPLKPSVSPQFGNNGMTSCYTLLRLFLCATKEGFAVMPGGLAITSDSIATLLSNNPERQQSKDIWVLSEQPVEPVSLLRGMESIVTFDRGSDLPSRVADNLLWLGRYLERAENRIRLLRTVYRRLSSETRLQDIKELPFLVILLSSQGLVQIKADSDENMPPYRDLEIELHKALFARNMQSNVRYILRRVQHIAQNVRDRLSMDCWRVINRIDSFFESVTSDPLDLLEETLFTLSCFSGVAMESMTRGLGWRFMDLGRRIERGINQAELLHVGLSRQCVSSKESLEALLEIADSLMTYRARYRTSLRLPPVLDLLLSDESNPKSLAFQLSKIAGHVDKLPRKSERKFETVEEQLALEMLTSIRLLNLSNVPQCPDDPTDNSALINYLESTLGKIREFSQSIGSHYLSRVPTTPHFSMLSDS